MRKALLLFGFLAALSFAPLTRATTLSVSTAIYPPATQNVAYVTSTNGGAGSALLNIVGGTPGYTPMVIAGALPPGMTLSVVTPITPDGLVVLSGTPTTPGSYTFTIRVTDTATPTPATADSASLTFLVYPTTGRPVIGTITCTAVTSTSENCSWPTDILSDSSVCYGTLNTGNHISPNFCTTPIDTATGTTSHSVTITGLAPGASFERWVTSRGFSGGVPQDYLKITSANHDCSNCPTFTTQAAPTTGAVDFGATVIPAGPILQHYPLYVSVFGYDLAGTSFHNQWNLQVTALCSFCKVHWPDVQDNGGSGTVLTGATTDDTLRLFSPGNDVFEILTDVGGTTPTGNYTLTLTATEVPTAGCSCGNAVHAYSVPFTITTSTFVPGTASIFPAIPHRSLWESNMTTYGNKWCGTASGSGQQTPWYYDGTWVFLQIAAYTGDTSHTHGPNAAAPPGSGNAPTVQTPGNYSWQDCATQSQLAYEAYGNPLIPPFSVIAISVFPYGLYNEWTQNGNVNAKADLHQLAIHAACNKMLTQTTCAFAYEEIREAAYKLEVNRLDLNAGGGTTLAQVKQAADYVVAVLTVMISGQRTTYQPFMFGLACEALIDYHNDPLTGPDPRVPFICQQAADFLWANAWVPGSGTNGQFLYEPFFFNNGIVPGLGVGTDIGSSVPGNVQDLNGLLVHLWGWLYSVTGDQKYLKQGDTIWDALATDSPNNHLNPSQGGGKATSQEFRSTPKYIVYRTPTTSVSLTPPTLSFGNVTVNVTSSAQTIVLQNTGAVNLTLAASAAITFTDSNSGLDAPRFTTTGATTCTNGLTLTPNQTCNIMAVFTPNGVRSFSATLNVADNAGTQTAALSGTGVPVPQTTSVSPTWVP